MQRFQWCLIPFGATPSRAFATTTVFRANINIEYYQKSLAALEKQVHRTLRLCIYAKKNADIEVLQKGRFEKLMEVNLTEDFPYKPILEKINGTQPVSLLQPVSLHHHVFDISSKADVFHLARLQIGSMFPHLRLECSHSAVEDVMGNRVHSFSIQLVLKEETAQNDLSMAELEAMKKFRGESVGRGFHKTARKALEEAFTALGVTVNLHQEFSVERSTQLLFLAPLHARNPDLKIKVNDGAVNGQVEVNLSDGTRVHASLTGERPLLHQLCYNVIQEALSQLNPTLYETIQADIKKHPITIVLPDTNLNVKRILRLLCAYYYGVKMEDIQFESSLLHHVHMTTLTINLPLRRYSLAAEDIPVEVAKVAGEKKQAAEELCAVLAIQRHFPSVFEEQIAYHPEISEILKGARTSKVDNGVCPPLSAGPRPRLEWAAKREGMQFRLTSDLLQPGRRYETFGVLTSINSWAARLYVSAPGKGEDLFCTTFDSKKAKAENKAMLCLLSKLNRNGEFDDSLEQGKTNKLLDENGLPTPCHEIVPITADTFRTDDLCDPVISSLSSEPADQRPNVEMGDVQPLLSQLRAFTKQENIVAKETIDHDELRDVFKVTLLSADDTVLTTYTHYNKIAATLSAYLQLKLDNETLNSEKTSILKKRNAELPSDKPLQFVCDAIYALYGLVPLIVVNGGNGAVHVQLSGRDEANRQRYFVGKGRGSDLIDAAVTCAKSAYSTHILRLQMPFVEEAVLLVKDQKLSLDGNSSLHNLLHLIKTEIEINTGKQCTVDLFASLSVSPQPFSMELAATTDKKKVQLESQTGTTLFDVLTKISDNVTAETGMKLQTDVSSDGDSVRYFSALCTDVFGVSPLLESSLNDGVWYTRVSVVVNSTYCYALSYASDARKKDSQARAANMALSFYFRKSLDLFRIKDCDTASVLNYFFIASETGKQVSEKDATSPESTDTPNE